MGEEPRSGDPEYYEALGRAIKVLRTAQGIDRKELARRADISYPYLSQIEAGTKRASSEVVRAISEALGLRPHELLENADSVMTTPPAAASGRAREASAPPEFERLEADAAPAERVAPLAFAMAAPPPPARQAARWFHSTPSSPPPPPGDRSRRELLGELIALTETLGDDDLERLVDLARRLAASPLP